MLHITDKNILLNSEDFNKLNISDNQSMLDEIIIECGDSVKILDVLSHEVFEVKVEMPYNKIFMTPIQKALLNYKIGETLNYRNRTYKIIDILKDI